MITFLLLIVAAFVAMEFVSYLVHRFVYHGILWFIHRSHHRPRTGRFEWNDIFPFLFAGLTILLMVASLSDPEGWPLVAVSIGITLYGVTYLVVHDLYVHRRMKSLRLPISYLQRVKKAHMVHHMHGGEPYGLLIYSIPRGVDVSSSPDEGGV